MRIDLDQAAYLINKGSVVAVPTETVYGLAASLRHPAAIGQIFTLKGRPANNPLIIHLDSPVGLQDFVQELPPAFEDLAAAFWPGPLTLVLPVDTSMVPDSVRAGLDTAAFRVPAHPLANRLLTLTGPLVMPSANLSGSPSSTMPEHVEHDFGSDFPVLDGGACKEGIESTVLIFHENAWMIIRQGALPPEAFVKVLGYEPRIESRSGEAPLCPGQLYRHYAPKCKLQLLEAIPNDLSGFLIGFTDRNYPSTCSLIYLGDSSHPETAAENLYTVLRRLDEEAISLAYVDFALPAQGLWLTIAERLRKAASL